MNIERAQELVAGRSHWHHDFEVMPGVRTNGSYDPSVWWNWMGIENSVAGARVLDIGANDGYFSLQLWRAGADVVAIDYLAKERTGFAVTQTITGMKAQFLHMNLFDLPDAGLGTFDFVIFLGVLYHLPDPYRAMSIVADVCRGRLFVETVGFHLDPKYDASVPSMRFFPGDSLRGDITNFWAQNDAGMRAMLADCGFEVNRVHSNSSHEIHRLAAEARRVTSPMQDRRRKLAYGCQT